MYPTDKGSGKDRSKGFMPTLSPVRRRLTSRLQPLHGGMGFGAGEIRERALVVARQASQRGQNPSRTVQTQRPVLGPMGQGLQFTEEKTYVPEMDDVHRSDVEVVQESQTQRRELLNQRVRREAAANTTASVKANGFSGLPQPLSVPSASPAVPSIKSFIVGAKRLAAPTAIQGLTAWFFDALIVLACLILAFGLSASVPFAVLLTQKVPLLKSYLAAESLQGGALGWLLLLGQTLTLASFLLFAIQAAAGFFLAASVGRAIANVRLASTPSPLGRAFKIGLGEMLQWPLAFGLLNVIVSPGHNFLVRSLRWARASEEA
jgi:hypothetical protein